MRPSVSTIRLALLAALIGVGCGCASALFLGLLGWATGTREANGWLVFLLPVGGLAVGLLYERFAGRAARGINIVYEAIHTAEPDATRAQVVADSNAALRSEGVISEAGMAEGAPIVPRRMLPLILVGTILTHLVGGSAGREGTAVQMGGSLAESICRALRLTGRTRRVLLLAGVSGGFASVFGTPVAGLVFALESPTRGRLAIEVLLPCLISALIGDLTARALGIQHTDSLALTPLASTLDAVLLLKIALAGVAFGLCARAFVFAVERIKHVAARIRRLPLRAALGGGILLVLGLLLNTRAYYGLSLPLVEASFTPEGVPPFAFALKLLFTAITLGMGFVGGEVTPLFTMGATLGSTLAAPLGISGSFLAAVGFVSVFAGASKAPITCMLMGIELFGAGVSGGAAVYLLVGCAVAYLVSGREGIYAAQR